MVTFRITRQLIVYPPKGLAHSHRRHGEWLFGPHVRESRAVGQPPRDHRPRSVRTNFVRQRHEHRVHVREHHIPSNVANNELERSNIGASFGGFVIEQVVRWLVNRGIPFNGPFFFRTSDGYELDLVLEIQSGLVAIETKLTTSPSRQDMNRLIKVAAMIGATEKVLVSKTTATVRNDDTLSTNLKGLLAFLKKTIKVKH
jgi:predicted AAA+ superfamily ATPase